MALLSHLAVLKDSPTLTFRLIKPKQKDPGGRIQTHLSSPATYASKSSPRRVLVFVLIFIFIPIFIGMPLRNANAGVFGFLSGLFTTVSKYENPEIHKEVVIDVVNTKTEEVNREKRVESTSLLALTSPILSTLKAALNIDPNPSKGGGDITVVFGSALLPETGPAGGLANIENLPKSDKISIYVVRAGDSLSEIAEMFNVSVDTIAWANDIERSNLIRVGQTLTILPITGVRHTVEKNDTLASIAKLYNADLEEITRYNDLSIQAPLSVGQIVVVPDGEIKHVAHTSYGYTDTSTNNVSTVAGYYIRPISGGRRSQGIHGYNAVDLAASVGTPIVAAASGEVLISRQGGWNGGYGNYVVIKHDNGTQTLYSHNNSNIVNSGEWVVKGQVIGYVGSTGKTTGPHVHFEIRGAKNPF
jgi:LysM repeat protein